MHDQKIDKFSLLVGVKTYHLVRTLYSENALHRPAMTLIPPA